MKTYLKDRVSKVCGNQPKILQDPTGRNKQQEAVDNVGWKDKGKEELLETRKASSMVRDVGDKPRLLIEEQKSRHGRSRGRKIELHSAANLK